ncbi:MAG: NAD(P)-binding domain-containing protein, partial [Prevotella sp.]|nr:NAD(P)-binding domain-containing protein [Prevotella sp.]
MKITMIGAGAMGGTTVEGLVKCGAFALTDITVSDPSTTVVEKFKKLGVQTTTDNAAAASKADVVCVCVKPWLVERVLTGIKDALSPARQLLVVIAAGVSSQSIKTWLG